MITGQACDAASVVTCAANAGDEIVDVALEPGRYYLFVEGDEPLDTGDFDVMVNLNRTAGQAQCVVEQTLDVMDPLLCTDPVFEDPYYDLLLSSEELAPGHRDDSYAQGVFSCGSDDGRVGGAPDLVYEVPISGGEHEVQITFSPDGWDGLVYLTGAPCGGTAAMTHCLDQVGPGDERIVAQLPEGTHYLVVDGFGEDVFDGLAWGRFDLRIQVYDEACND